jgi:hypothetical protein
VQFAGILPEDAPDPAAGTWRDLGDLTVPLIGLEPQAAAELIPVPSTTALNFVITQVSLSYTLWRYAEDRDDPRNLAALDDRTRRSLDEQPPWPRPAWLLAAVERLRYPTLHEATRTHVPRPEAPTVGDALREHVAYVLANRFREELGLGRGPGHWPRVPPSALERGVPIRLDGGEIDGVRIDTDPFVFGLGADLGDRGVFTAVFSRDDLPYISLRFRSFDVAQLAP